MHSFVDSPDFWDNQYKNNEVSWDMKSATPAFIELLQNTIVFDKDKGDILVAGSGKGYDAVEAAKNGFSVTALDISTNAADFAKQLAEKENVKLKILVRNIFLLTDEYKCKYDFIYDYTTYCAINPERREEYIKTLYKLLKPGGKVVAILFPVEKREGGPPFEINSIETYKLFSKYFILQYFSKKLKSIKPRAGREVLHVYKKVK